MANGADLPRRDEMISVFDAFRTTQAFLEAFWKRGLEQNDELAGLLSVMEMYGNPPMPLDAAQWDDWIDAIDRATHAH